MSGRLLQMGLVVSVVVLALFLIRAERTNHVYSELLNTHASNSFNTGLVGIESVDRSIREMISRGTVSSSDLIHLRSVISGIPYSLGEVAWVSSAMGVETTDSRSLNEYLYYDLEGDLLDIARGLPDSIKEWPFGDQTKAQLSFHSDVLGRLATEIRSYQSLEAEAPTPTDRFVWSEYWTDLIEKMNSIAAEARKGRVP